MDRDKDTIFDILHAGQLIQQFKAGMTQAEFRQDPKTQSAILHQIPVMGEAVKRLSLAFRAQHPDIPWRQIAGMSDFLIHAYDSVDLDTVWQVTERDIPDLLGILSQLRPSPPVK